MPEGAPAPAPKPRRRRPPRRKGIWTPDNFTKLITTLVVGIVTITGAIVAGWNSIHNGLQKGADERKQAKVELTSELGMIHAQTNGHLSAMQSKLDEHRQEINKGLQEIIDLKKIISERAIEKAAKDGHPQP
jgi:hypothetical protein